MPPHKKVLVEQNKNATQGNEAQRRSTAYRSIIRIFDAAQKSASLHAKYKHELDAIYKEVNIHIIFPIFVAFKGQQC